MAANVHIQYDYQSNNGSLMIEGQLDKKLTKTFTGSIDKFFSNNRDAIKKTILFVGNTSKGVEKKELAFHTMNDVLNSIK